MGKISKEINPHELDSMYNGLSEYLSNMITLEFTDIEKLHSIFKPLKIKKHSHFISGNIICREIAYLHRGMVRFYHVKKNEEITSDFSFEGTFITSYVSLITQEPSDVNIQALEDSSLLVIKYDKLLELYETSHKFERIGRLIAENTFLNTRSHLLSFFK